MGSSHWSDSFYAARDADRASKGIKGRSTSYTADVSSGVAARKTHEKMDPMGVKVRESRDSDAHPNSFGIGILFDVTGSMGQIPITLQSKLGGLMALLIKKGVVDPQVLFGAIGDASCDVAPLQIGQFESGVEMDEDLDHIFVEGGGGGQTTESYELGAYFMARHVAMDCLEKRGKKGYLFFIADEHFYPKVKRAEVEKFIGDKIEADIPTTQIFKELKEKFEVYCLYPKEAAYYAGDPSIRRRWVDLLGQNVIYLEKAEEVCETIAAVICASEGLMEIDEEGTDLVTAGVDSTTARNVAKALAPLSAHGALSKPASMGSALAEPKGKKASVKRL